MVKRRKASSPREEKKCRLRYDAIFFLNADQLTFSAVEMIPKGMLWMEKSESGLVSMKDMLTNVLVVGEEVVEWSGVEGCGDEGKEEREERPSRLYHSSTDIQSMPNKPLTNGREKFMEIIGQPKTLWGEKF